MQTTPSRLAALVLFLAFFAVRAEDATPVKPSKGVELILKRTNAERAAEKLPPLTLDPKLTDAAQKHTDDMARQKKMQHTLDDKGPADRVRKAGYTFGHLGENIAMGMAAEDVVGDWMKSKGHRANILGKDFTQIGIGIAKDEDGAPYYTQVFGKPLGSDDD